MAAPDNGYYLPEPSHWPIIGSVGIFAMLWAFAAALHGAPVWYMGFGFAIIVYMLFGWFGTVISESEGGLYNAKVDRSFRWGMAWFIFSEIMFFFAFFGVLFYVRIYAVPWLGGDSNNVMTPILLWDNFVSIWPTNGPANVGGEFEPMGAWGVPAINTAILLVSGYTCTMAHHALKEEKRQALVLWLLATVLLGVAFLYLQAEEYIVLYQDHNMRLDTGIYGATFFMLTGFHGFHVCLGTTMLLIIMLRSMKGHFKPENHFAFEAVAWYWHFVDAVWLILFVFVYVLI